MTTRNKVGAAMLAAFPAFLIAATIYDLGWKEAKVMLTVLGTIVGTTAFIVCGLYFYMSEK